MLKRANFAIAIFGGALLILVSPAHALDLNSFRRAHHLPPLAVSSTLTGLAYEQAGKVNEAVKQLKLYLRAAPKANDRPMVEKKLEQLRR